MNHPNQLISFRNYLSSLPDDLLTSLTRCYIWLAGLRFTEGKFPTGLDLRRDCCLDECARRRRSRGRVQAARSSPTRRAARR
jgi:hypothetical protein